MRKPTSVRWGGPRANAGGRREGAGRPKGSKTKVYRPHVERILAETADYFLPKQVLFAIMNRHFAGWDAAERTAGLLAPFVHPKLTAAAIMVRPKLSEMSDDELAAFVEEAEREAGITDEDAAGGPRLRRTDRCRERLVRSQASSSCRWHAVKVFPSGTTGGDS